MKTTHSRERYSVPFPVLGSGLESTIESVIANHHLMMTLSPGRLTSEFGSDQIELAWSNGSYTTVFATSIDLVHFWFTPDTHKNVRYCIRGCQSNRIIVSINHHGETNTSLPLPIIQHRCCFCSPGKHPVHHRPQR